MGYKNDLCSGILNGCGQGKITFVKATKKDVAVSELQDEQNLDNRSNCITAQERLLWHLDLYSAF